MVGLLAIFKLLTKLPVAQQVDLSTTTFSELVRMNYPSCVARKSALSPSTNMLSSKVILFGHLYLNHVYLGPQVRIMLSADQTTITTEPMCNLLSTILSLMTLIVFAVFWLKLSHATFLPVFLF